MPVAVNAAGEKLSKQTGASPVVDAKAAIARALGFLGQPAETLEDAVRRWDPAAVPGQRAVRYPD